MDLLGKRTGSLLKDNMSVQFNKHGKSLAQQRNESLVSNIQGPLSKHPVSDDLLNTGPDGKHFKMPVLPGLLP